MLDIGSDQNQESRIRQNLLSQNASFPQMHTLIKDHKALGKDNVARTRPVVNGNEGMNAPLNNILNTLIEQVASRGKRR